MKTYKEFQTEAKKSKELDTTQTIKKVAGRKWKVTVVHDKHLNREVVPDGYYAFMKKLIIKAQKDLEKAEKSWDAANEYMRQYDEFRDSSMEEPEWEDGRNLLQLALGLDKSEDFNIIH